MSKRNGLFYLIRPAAGGMHSHLRELLAYFGENYCLHLASPESMLSALVKRSGGRFYQLPLRGMLCPRDDYRVYRDLCRALQETRPLLLHTHGFKAALLGGAAACRTGTPLLNTVHNFPADAAARLLPFVQRHLCAPQVRFITVSRALRGLLCHWGVDPDRIAVIPNGIETLRFAGAARQRRLNGRQAVVGTVARLAPQKGVAVFLQAAAQLAALLPTLTFRVFGEGPERPALERLAKKLGLGGRIEFRGYCGDLPAELGAIDIFVLSSFSEGLSIALLEAAAAGCPVVASHCGGIPEVVEEGVTGLLVPPGDPFVLAARIMEMLRRPAEARRMAGAAVERVRREFSRETMLQRTAAVYREMGAHCETCVSS